MLSPDDINTIEKSIRKYNAKVIALQVPEGLKTEVQAIAGQIEKSGVNVIIFADPCFGACDIPCTQMAQYNCDLIVHIGHSEMFKKQSIPIAYIEYFSDTDVAGILKKEMTKLKNYKSIALATSIQHIKQIPKVSGILKSHQKKVLIGKSTISKYPGQVLGCDPSAVISIQDKADCILYFGTGRFHALGIAKKTDLPVFLLSLEDKKIHSLKKEQFILQKKKIIRKAKYDNAKVVCIVATTKPGQMNKNVVEIKKKIEKKGKRVFIAIMDVIKPESLLGMDYDIILNTACPRIEEDVVFKKPVINVEDVLE
ncbi:MAG: diphthamide biosynthesis enzyme Dph2 [Candidatus Nanohalarchaeota archaeon]|nr:MAG: diphthamide biosynthesis enzyme Dph2 [Candidatus Nanohaloarchaeota archaeon]